MTTMTTSTVSSAASFATLIAPFAAAIGKTSEQVGEALKPIIGEPSAEAFELLKSDEFTPFSKADEELDLKRAFSDVAPAKLKKAVADHLREKPAAAPQPAQGAAAASPAMSSLD